MKLTDMQKNVAAIVFFVTLAFGVDYRYAKQDAFAEHIRSGREKELLEILYECKTKYKGETHEFIKERCKDAEIEYKLLNPKKKKKGEK